MESKSLGFLGHGSIGGFFMLLHTPRPGPPKMFQSWYEPLNPRIPAMDFNATTEATRAKNHWLLRIFILTVWNNQRRNPPKKTFAIPPRAAHAQPFNGSPANISPAIEEKKGGMSGMSLARLDWNGQGIPRKSASPLSLATQVIHHGSHSSRTRDSRECSNNVSREVPKKENPVVFLTNSNCSISQGSWGTPQFQDT